MVGLLQTQYLTAIIYSRASRRGMSIYCVDGAIFCMEVVCRACLSPRDLQRSPAARPAEPPSTVLRSNRWPAITTCTLIGLKSGSSDRFICVCDVGQWEAGGGAVARAAVGGPLDSASHRLRARQSLARFLPTMFIPDTLRSCMVEPDVSTYLQAPSSGQVHLF